MRTLPAQQQTLESTIEYEFDVASLLNDSDSIASVNWDLPSELTLVNSLVSGTKVRAFIAAEAVNDAKIYASYWVGFMVNSVGSPTPVSPELSFEVKIVKRIKVAVI